MLRLNILPSLMRRLLEGGRKGGRHAFAPIPVRVAFHGFWPGFSLKGFNAAHPYLKLKYQLVECRRDPDVHFVSVFRPSGRKWRDASRIPVPRDGATTVYYTGEQVAPDMSRFHWSMSYDNGRSGTNLYLPGWVRHLNRLGLTPYSLLRSRAGALREAQPRRPCAYVVRNRTPLRECFFDILSRRMEIASPGRSRNNHPAIGPAAAEKLAFLRNFRFNLAFENERFPGYLTEKIADAFIAGCVPIYWGDPLVEKAFSPDAFIHVQDESGFGEAIERILAVEADPRLLTSMQAAAPLLDNRLPDYATHDYAMAFFERIFDDAVRR